MNTWISRGLVAATVLVSGAAAAVMVLAEMGERKLDRHVEVDRRAGRLPQRCGRHRARRLPVPLARMRRLSRRRRRRPRRDRRRQRHAGALARHHAGTERRDRRLRPEDWVRTIRHGVKRDGRPVMIMPSEEYNRLVDADLAIARRLRAPAAAGRRRERAEVRLPMPVKVLYAAGVVRDASEKIDHSLPPGAPVPEGVTRRARRLRRQRLHRLPRRAPRRRQDPGRAAGLAAGGQAQPPARAARSTAIRAPSSSWRC